MTRPDLIPRRSLLQAGAIGLMGLDLASLKSLRAADPLVERRGTAKSVLFIFLSGGLSQLDSFDMKPDGPSEIRGEFSPIATRTPGVQICEHLPKIAGQSDKWALVRSLTHWSNEHNEAHTLMLTGRSQLPPGWREKQPQPTDWPSIAATIGRLTADRSVSLPSAVVVPQRLVNMNQGGVVTPGQFGGLMGERHDPWFVEAAPYRGKDVKGAFPDYSYRRSSEKLVADRSQFQAPVLELPEGLTKGRMLQRLELMRSIDQQRRDLDRVASVQKVDRFRRSVASLLTDPQVRRAFDVTRADDATLDRYGRNSFGWTLLMARRLLDAGVTLVQANLGNYNTWDLHGGIFKISRDWLYPPADQAIAALLQDLADCGQLADTLVVIASEFGRTPKIFKVPNAYVTPGRDHWGAVQTAVFAGGGVRGGNVIGSSDRMAEYPASDPQSPEDFAATIYHALGLPPDATWRDSSARPHFVYHGQPIGQLFS
ncbi:MAG: DUF1501 domain-containing protein [Pirellulaceae bacterium]|nr:DUF1501 domain-containing protein [Pirellulaceae bacterium]